MSIGPAEVVLLMAVSVIALFIRAKTKLNWVIGVPVFFAIATVFSPADPFSTMLIAVPCCFVYSFALLKNRPSSGTSV